MAIHHKIPQSRNGPDEEWNRVELTDYEHALGHALDFVLFEEAPNFDCRQPGWPLLPEDLQDAVRAEISRRMSGNKIAVGHGHTRLGDKNGMYGKVSPTRGRKRTPEERRRISEANKGKVTSLETREKISQARLGKKLKPQPPNNPNRKKAVKQVWDNSPDRRRQQSELFKHNNPGSVRACCLFCQKETTKASITQHHKDCK
jgi:hypothetical protein